MRLAHFTPSLLLAITVNRVRAGAQFAVEHLPAAAGLLRRRVTTVQSEANRTFWGATKLRPVDKSANHD
jgi:type IV secretory pathway VirB3-like protein